MKRKLIEKRNCKGKYPSNTYRVRVPIYGIITQCPTSAIDKQSHNLYSIVKECNNIGMGGDLIRPSLFYSEANMYFEIREIVLSIISEIDKMNEAKNKSKK